MTLARSTTLSVLGLLTALACLALACLDRPVGAPDPVTTNVFTTQNRQTSIDKIDLLFMIDNSGSMNDKQVILRTAVPDLVNRLVNPICVDEQGNQFPAAPPGEECPPGQFREFRPVNDIHVGVISSSLGDSGANDGCQGGETEDGARLVGSLPRAEGVTTNEHGFLSWTETSDVRRFTEELQDLVISVGEEGCGWEASLEGWYRFLIDPVPYSRFERVPCSEGETDARCQTVARDETGAPLLDRTLLEQRAAFLRDDSLLAIVMLTDENDCSIASSAQSWVMGSYTQRPPMIAGSAACADNPDSECCYPCTLGPPTGCEWADTVCAEVEGVHIENRLAPEEDATNLRCFDQKRRFGIDFLYPTQRYVNALTQLRLCPSNPDLSVEGCNGQTVDNPLFAGQRQPSNVFLAGIVGVPWQLIATEQDENGVALPADALRFKPATELTEQDWLELIGMPNESPPVPPASPLMQESTQLRPGVTPGGPNGREYDTAAGNGYPSDLQYSCIFPLTRPRTCEPESVGSCDCAGESTPTGQTPAFDRPLCEEQPGLTEPGNIQHWAKAYPGLRQLEVLKGYGDNSIVASICARNVNDDQRRDFGYRPAIAALVDRLADQLTRRCLPRPMELRSDQSVACTLVEARAEDGDCRCDESLARSEPQELVARSVRTQLAQTNSPACIGENCQDTCLCELQQLTEGPALSACREDAVVTGYEGWCYIADSDDQRIGNPALLSQCAPTERRMLRVVGQGAENGSLTVISCSGRSFAGE